jgi:hypothetical protein
MGGGTSSVTPTTPPGYTGGSVMDYTAPAFSPSPVQSGGYNTALGVIGSSAKGAGKGFSAMQTPVPEFSTPQVPNAGIADSSQEMIQALLRLLGGSNGRS